MIATERLCGIFGVGRNGSSLLMRLLDGSPGLWMYPIELNVGLVERGLRTYAGAQSEAFGAFVRQQQDELWDSYVSQLVEPLGPEPARLDEEAARTFRSPEQAVVEYLDRVRATYGADRVHPDALLAFKSTEASDVALYERRFPGIRCIHIVRNPFTAYASLKRTDMLQKRMPFWFQGDLLQTFLERRWLPHATFLIDALARSPERHYLVTYEDLVRDPVATVHGICAWLGIEAPVDEETQTVLGGREVRQLPKNVSKDGVPTPARVVRDMQQRYDYEDVLTSRERRFIALRTRDLASRLGYEVGDPGRRLPLLGQWILPDRWEMMNVSSKARLAVALVARRVYVFGQLLQRQPSNR